MRPECRHCSFAQSFSNQITSCRAALNHSSPLVSISVVSHGQAHLVQALLKDLDRLPNSDFEMLVTLNLPEDESVYRGYSFPLLVIANSEKKGFGANHNAAFQQARGKFFAVVNPDIRLESLDLRVLTSPFEMEKVAAVAPLVLSESGNIEDSARRFPTFMKLCRRVLLRQRQSDYVPGQVPQDVDWVAGMFVLFRSDVYQSIGGFDDRRFYMYMEDVDICRRLRSSGWRVILNPHVSVCHMAQRASRRNWQHMRWHVVSAFRYLTRL